MQSRSQGWWLYGDDLRIARELQIEAIHKLCNSTLRSYQVSLLTYLGSYKDCQLLLNKYDLVRFPYGKHAEFKVRLVYDSSQAWLSLIEDYEIEVLKKIESSFDSERQPIVVDLVGGIGDQLQNASLCLALNRRGNLENAVRIRPCGENASLVSSFLESSNASSIMYKDGDTKVGLMAVKFVRKWLDDLDEQVMYDQLYPNDWNGTRPISCQSFLTCWRSKLDALNPLSSFSRSLSFWRIVDFYGHWSLTREQSDTVIFDITSYTDAELKILSKSFPSIQFVRKIINNLFDTFKLMKRCRGVITVDTSLVHLSVLCGHDVQLLLPMFPDERWLELLSSETLYAKHVNVFQQKRFHDWSDPLQSLQQNLSLHSQ